MSAEDILTVSAAAVALTEIVKRATRRNARGRWVAPAPALPGVAV
jgi:hypothetical protein